MSLGLRALALWFLLAVGPPAASRPVQLRLEKAVCTAPCAVTATVTVPKHPDNRHVSVIWGYADADSRTWDLGPDTQQVEFTVRIESLPAGEHTIYTVLLREHEGEQKTFDDSQRISVRPGPTHT